MRRALHRDQDRRATRALLPVLLFALTLAAPGLRAADVRTSEALRVDRSSARHEWWNERWARIRSLEGLWQTSSEGARVRLRPEAGSSARIAVHSVLTGETVNYALDRGGEVLIAPGWIVVNQRGEPTLSASKDDELTARAPGMNGQLMVPLHRVHRIEWSGAVGTFVAGADPEHPERELEISARFAAQCAGEVARVHLYSGRVVEVQRSASDVGLRLVQVRTEGGADAADLGLLVLSPIP